MPHIDLDVIATCLFIVAARICDVSIGTIRTMTVINGRRFVSWVLGFFEVLIWIVVVSKVIGKIGENPLYPVAYALGFATGNYVGITIESRLAYGRQVVRVFTRRMGGEGGMAAAMRAGGYRVTEFDGRGRDGPVAMLYIETSRKSVPDVADLARRTDPECYYVVDDIRLASERAAARRPGGWLSVLKRK